MNIYDKLDKKLYKKIVKSFFITTIIIGLNSCGSSIHQSSMEGDIKSLNSYLNNGIDINSQDELGRTVLIEASANGHINMVKHLINKGANTNISDNRGLTPLMVASLYSHEDIVKLLLENGALLNKQNLNGDTALLLAIRAKSSQSIIDILVKNNADITLKNTRGETAESLFKQNILMQAEYQNFLDSFDTNDGKSTIIIYGLHVNSTYDSPNALLVTLGHGIIIGLMDAYNDMRYIKVDFNVLVNKNNTTIENIGKLNNNNYLEYKTDSTYIQLYADINKENQISINLEPQKLYCIQAALYEGMVATEPQFKLVENHYCFESIKDYKLQKRVHK
ncbi:ankyrin repeat domain-containing protein [Sulfurimonas sp.]|nr:ankyrin repeat domain-containing protein [Sulfurimonas sp.]